MATIAPYGDPSAHGKLNDSLMFRRYRGAVHLQQMPRKKKRTGPAIEAQRQKLIDAMSSWRMQTDITKAWYRKRAEWKQIPGRAYYIKAFMKGFLASTEEQTQCKQITNAVLYDPLSTTPSGILYEFFGNEPSADFWCQLRSAANVIAPEIGPAGEITGTPTYEDAKFGKGITNINTTNYVLWPDAFPCINDGIMDFYWIPKFGDDTVTSKVIIAFISGLFRFQILFIGSTGAIEILAQYNSGAFQPRYRINIKPFEANDKIRLTVVFNSAGTATNRIQLYWNKVLCTNQTVMNDTPWNYPTFPLGLNPPGFSDIDAILDNLIIIPGAANIANVLANDKEAPPTEVKKYGELRDNQKEWIPDQTLLAPQSAFLTITNLTVPALEIPHYYEIGIDWIDTNDEERRSTIRIGKLKIEDLETVTLFFAWDWSLYTDISLHRLFGTNKN